MDANGAAPTGAPPPVKGVYLIRSGPYVKIGKTDCFTSRLADYTLHNPQAELVAFVPSDTPNALERYLHTAFIGHLYRGEWYHLDDAGVEAVTRAALTVSAGHLEKFSPVSRPAFRRPRQPADRSGSMSRGDPEDLGGGRWRIRVFLGRDDLGKQIRKSKTFKADGIRRARLVAQQLEVELRAELEREREGRRRDTFANATERWWDLWRQRDRSPTTRQGYRRIIDNHILAAPFRDRKVVDLKVGDFDRWYSSLAEARKAATVQRIHAIVVQVLDQCIRDGDLVANPATKAHRPAVRHVRRAHTPVDDVREILAAAHVRSPVRARALAFAALTGLRRGEMAGVRWSRVDVDQGVLIVEWNTVIAQRQFIGKAAELGAGGSMMSRVVKDPKAHQVAAISLGDQAAGIARAQMEWQRSEANFAGVDPAGDPWLWQVRPPFDEPLWPDTLSHWMIDARKAAGHSNVRLHDLRHWQASSMLEVGATVEDVRERLRHRSIQTTMRYLEADTSKQAGFVALLPQLQLPAG